MGLPRDYRGDDHEEQDDSQPEEEVAEGAGDAFPAEPFIADTMFFEPALGHQPVIQTAALSCNISVFETRLEKIKPVASSASSEWF